METAISTPDACMNPCSLLEETPAMAARRRRTELRRLKLMSNSGNFSDLLKKRTRTRNARVCSNCFGREGTSLAEEDAENSLAMEIELQSHTLYPARRLVRSVSTPIGWNSGLLCTCRVEKYWTSEACDKQNSISSTSVNEKNKFNSSSNDNNNNSNKDDSIIKVAADAEPVDQGSTQQEATTDSKPQREKSSSEDENNNNKKDPPSLPPPLPAAAGKSNVPAPATQGSKQRTTEQDIPLNRPLKGIGRANSESISFLLKDPCPPHSTMSIIGRRREMEDAVSAVPSFFSIPKGSSIALLDGFPGFVQPPLSTALHFFAVYDGHGGSQASVFCKDRFHEALAEELRNSSPFCIDLNDWSRVMSTCFTKIDMAVGGMCPNGSCGSGDSQKSSDCCQDPIAPENVGSTAVVAIVSPSQLVIANCGDSRAVLSRGGKAIPLSSDHKPEREDELSRIEAAGGRVIFWNGYRVGGFLAMSRAIGDRFLKRYVISEPEVTCTERTHEDECLILASDGLWDVLSNDVVCEVARKCLAGYRPHRSKGITEDTPVGAAAALLTKLALGRGSGDNISVVVIDLKERRNRNR